MHSEEPTTLHIKVVEACNVPKMDSLTLTADPYCILSIKSKKETHKKTPKMTQTYKPVWKKTFKFENVTESDVLCIQMRDWDFGSKDDPIANIEIPLNQNNLRERPCDSWYQMTKASSKLPKDAKIRLVLYLAPSDKGEDLNTIDKIYYPATSISLEEAESALSYVPKRYPNVGKRSRQLKTQDSVPILDA